MFPVYDVAIVGGGPAGIATALFLHAIDPALASRTVILEKDAFPRDKYCAGAIGERGDRLLRAIGVDPPVPQIRLRTVSIDLGVGSIAVRGAGPTIGRIVRRLEFDAALAGVAIQRGIEVRENARVERLAIDRDRVVVRTSEGEVHARVVVGADGVGSVVRKAVGATLGRLRAHVIEVDTEEVPGDPPRDTIHFVLSRRDLVGYVWDFPTLLDGRPMMCRGVYQLRLGRGLDTSAVLAAHLGEKGLSMSGYRLKQFAERGLVPAEPFAVPRVLLVGEAAGIDPLTGEGISQAFEYGWLAAEYLARAFGRRDVGFADWQSHVLESSLGRGLRVRRLVYRALYGETRPVVERLFARCPDMLALGLAHFAGDPYDRRAIMRALGHIVIALPALAGSAIGSDGLGERLLGWP